MNSSPPRRPVERYPDSTSVQIRGEVVVTSVVPTQQNVEQFVVKFGAFDALEFGAGRHEIFPAMITIRVPTAIAQQFPQGKKFRLHLAAEGTEIKDDAT